MDRLDDVKYAKDEYVDVVCECHCGHDHGGGADSGCGRWWIASHRVATS